jgi:hypothetical protein
MSSFQEIKNLFTNEIVNAPQYLVATKIKNLIIQDINEPKINSVFTYELQNNDFSDYTDFDIVNYESQIIVLSLKIILGFECQLQSKTIYIQMKKFLD